MDIDKGKEIQEWGKLKEASRIVIKVGTSTLTHQTGNLNLMRMESLVRQLADLKNQGRQVLLVTSAAIGAGMGRLNIGEKPPEIAKRQALAAVGQGILMQTYEKLFSEYGVAVAQVLLTKDDVADRRRYLNARSTLWQIMEYGAVPVINENDTVTFDEIKVGDNDTLAAMVAGLVDADLLVLLSDIDGLYTADPRKDETARLIPMVEEITPAVEALAGDPGSKFGSGGMATKIAAARIAVTQGIPMALVNGSRKNCLQFLNGAELSLPEIKGHSPAEPSGLEKAGMAPAGKLPEITMGLAESAASNLPPAMRAGLSGAENPPKTTEKPPLAAENSPLPADVPPEANATVRISPILSNAAWAWGTLFLPKAHPLGSRKGWLAFSTRCAGSLQVDLGAAQAILERGKSLLPSGITGVLGEFGRGSVLEVTFEGRIIARGISNYDSEDLIRIIGKKSREIDGILGPGHEQEAIHRDNLSLWS
ncbi:MAG: glutamate 5-kinase [Peptococcaceae bacterium]|nr:glutamate 5-kinase [Peptococcaceae bacterium]